MASDNKLELVVEVDVDRANASIKTINRSLSSIERAAGSAAQGASRGIDGIAVSVAKGAAAATLLTGAFQRLAGWVREYTVEAARLAARNETLAVVTAQLARANGYTEGSIERLVERVKHGERRLDYHGRGSKDQRVQPRIHQAVGTRWQG